MLRLLKSSPCLYGAAATPSGFERALAGRPSRNEAGEELLRERRLLQFLFLSFDQDGDGLLSYRDFADGMLSLLLLAAIQKQLCLSYERHEETPTAAAVHQQQEDEDQLWTSWVSRWLLLHLELLVIAGEIDADGSGAIELSEFLAATLDASLLSSQPALRKAAFRMLNRSGDGALSLSDLKSCIKGTQIDGNTPALDMQLQAILSAGDVDGDGRVTLQDFELFVQSP